MTRYHAVMLDETGCEFGHTFDASDRNAAYAYIDEMFVESRLVQLEDDEDTRLREKAMYERIQREMDGNYYDDYEEDL